MYGFICGPCIQEYWEEVAITKTTFMLVFSLWLVVFEKFLNIIPADHLKKCGLLSNFQWSFRFFQSTTDLLTVVSDRITRAFNSLIGLGLLELWHLIYLRLAFAGFGMLVFFTNLNNGISGQVFSLILSFVSNRWLRVVLDGKSLQE